ncbi:hypothetical protein GpartN1_g625.t1 [Galdieria partita]|uniref:Nuclease associated modular domain-containing protein n=1 Tax=Galdieria partita TaxID=83374 RepID=A0A9C7PR07_9RHOD|nr:hypothetical protein GpartN1_g625.t1 [Galdieria partita]
MYLFMSTFPVYCYPNNITTTQLFDWRKDSQVDMFQGSCVVRKRNRKILFGAPMNRKYLLANNKEMLTTRYIITNIYTDDIAETNMDSSEQTSLTTNQEKTSSKTSNTEHKKHKLPEEVRRKISMAMIGRKKSKAARAAMSIAKKGMVSPNKGHKLTIEARARLSLSMLGRRAWNKGRQLSMKHKIAIANSLSNRKLSQEHRQKLRLARWRPTDRILRSHVISSKVQKKLESSQDVKDCSHLQERKEDHIEWPLLTTQEINEYVSLRRELRVWSEKFSLDGYSTPSLSTLRRKAPKAILKKYEKYLEYRERFRGLAFDVYGKIAPGSVSVSPRGGRWRRTQTNKCFDDSSSFIESSPPELLDSSLCQCEEIQKFVASNTTNHSSICLTPSAYRILGRYRLLETHDIHEFVALRKELRSWSSSYFEEHGRRPTLQDAEKNLCSESLKKFKRYIQIREQIQGLVRETFGIEQLDMNSIEAMTETSLKILNSLKFAPSDANVKDILGMDQSK